MKTSTIFLVLLEVFQVSTQPIDIKPIDIKHINGTDFNLTLVERATNYDRYAPRRGLPFTDVNMIQHMCGNQMSWAYNWDSPVPNNFPGCLRFVPMLWGNQPVHTDVWWANVNDAINRGAREVLSFNEPDGCGADQACMSAQDAANAYRQYMMPLLSRGVAIGAPAITNGPNGISWLREFLGLCGDCVFHFQPIHWYDAAWNVGYFQNHVNDIMSIVPNRGIWITEFHARGSVDEQASFLRQVMPWMDSIYWISNYAYMMADPNFWGGPLVQSDGWATDLGNVFKDTSF